MMLLYKRWAVRIVPDSPFLFSMRYACLLMTHNYLLLQATFIAMDMEQVDPIRQ